VRRWPGAAATLVIDVRRVNVLVCASVPWAGFLPSRARRLAAVRLSTYVFSKDFERTTPFASATNVPGQGTPRARGSQAMWAMTASPKALHDTSFAPSISRAKS